MRRSICQRKDGTRDFEIVWKSTTDLTICIFWIELIPVPVLFLKCIEEIGEGLHGKESCKESHQESREKGRQKSSRQENGQDREEGRQENDQESSQKGHEKSRKKSRKKSMQKEQLCLPGKLVFDGGV